MRLSDRPNCWRSVLKKSLFVTAVCLTPKVTRTFASRRLENSTVEGPTSAFSRGVLAVGCKALFAVPFAPQHRVDLLVDEMVIDPFCIPEGPFVSEA